MRFEAYRPPDAPHFPHLGELRGINVKRQWWVRPDPETGIADRQEIVQGFLDAEVMLNRAGGALEIVAFRVPVGDGSDEMWTQAIGFTWLDRTDGKRKPQPEVAASAYGPPPDNSDPDPDLTPEELEEQLAAHEDLAPAQQRAMSREKEFLEQAATDEDETAMETIS